MAMITGIQNETLSNLITVDSQYLDRTTIRRKIVSEYKNTVHGYRPGGEAAVYELYSYTLTHYLPTRFPKLFKVESGKFHNIVTKKTFSAQPPQDPNECLQILAETIEEDIFLLKETDTTHVCLAFVCCFPTGFDPSAKLGDDLAGIHGPVPHYDKIGPSMERYFRKIMPGQVVRRMNVGICSTVQFVVMLTSHSQDLINVAGNHIKEGDTFVADENVDPSDTFLYPVENLKKDGSGVELADAIEGLQRGNAPGMHKYKGAIRWGKLESLVQYLRS
ncbi:hypothetical protein N7456_004640 [Penicillium angulare]|uniref:Uncharacterized protein n=1 Tax=Penicillium angulare TaxID=116970 RepID=A0A9W9FWY7_9EURO|nr:hypothetical protein N7456_004640 [Penicillium angulare]